MRFTPTIIDGVFIADIEARSDARGFFARLSCPQEFAAAGIDFEPRQTSLSRNSASQTLRGMHFSTAPEAKLVRCTRGAIHDVAFDIRPQSPTYGRAFGLDLDAESSRALYFPEGVAHGFLTLEADSDVLYQMNRLYQPGSDGGLRWNDPFFNYRWPAKPAVIDARDSAYPDFRRAP